MTNTGREVASGQLWMTKGENIKVCVRVTAHCGTPDLRYQGQMNIYEESLNRGGPGATQPTRVITFANISDVTALNSAVPAPFSSSPSRDSPFSLSLELSSQQRIRQLWGFMLLLVTGEALEMFSESQAQQQLWVKHLALLAMFPYSPIPEEPRVNPIRDGFRARLNPANFNADSVWPVYILAEEVGTRIQALGVHIVTLRSALHHQSPAQMRIISPLDMTPIITWEADKMRRTGNLGNMAFVEIGRRCEGGPGLVWMYTSPEDAPSFRETLGKFLFNGDGRRDTTYGTSADLPEPTYMYDCVAGITPTTKFSSSSSSFPSAPRPTPAFHRGNAVYDYAESPPVSNSFEPPITGAPMREFPFSKAYEHVQVDSFPPPSVLKSSSLPLTSNPPPVNLTTHPSRKKMSHKRSHSSDESAAAQQQKGKHLLLGRTDLSSGVLNRQTSGSSDSGFPADSLVSIEGEFSAIDETLSNLISELSTQSESSSTKHEKPEVLDDYIAQLEGLAAVEIPTPESSPASLHRSNSVPSGPDQQRKPKRANSTSTCQPTHYFKMNNPRMAVAEDGYVLMQPTRNQSGFLIPKEERAVNLTADVMSGLQAIQEESVCTKKGEVLSFDFLNPTFSTITEGSSLTSHQEPPLSPPPASSNYENHPLPASVTNAKQIVFHQSYQNVSRDATGQLTPSSVTTQDDDPDGELYMNQTEAHPPSQNRNLSTTWNELQFLENVLQQFVAET